MVNIGDRIVVTTSNTDMYKIGAKGTVIGFDENSKASFVKFDEPQFLNIDEWYVYDFEMEVIEKIDLIEEVKPTNIQQIHFAKTKPSAIIPSKALENAGYDVYACFEEDTIEIRPHQTVMIPTGIASACSTDYYFQLFERGSTGTKGIGQRCGVIDSGYRKEWFVPVTNHNTKTLLITKLESLGSVRDNYIVYPYEKAICQAILLPVPVVEVVELSYEELLEKKSDRMFGDLGSTNK